MTHVDIRFPQHGEGPALSRLYRRAFEGYRERGSGLGLSQLREHTVVAAGPAGRIVGLGCFQRIDRFDPRGELARLVSCLAPEVRAILDPQVVPEGAPELPIRIHAPRGPVPTVREGDMVFTALAVDPAFRRRGVGTALALARMRLATERHARRIWVHCVEGSGSDALYRGLGFSPLLRRADHYRPGLAMHLMTCAL